MIIEFFLPSVLKHIPWEPSFSTLSFYAISKKKIECFNIVVTRISEVYELFAAVKETSGAARRQKVALSPTIV